MKQNYQLFIGFFGLLPACRDIFPKKREHLQELPLSVSEQ
jgi:hypothetical protein